MFNIPLLSHILCDFRAHIFQYEIHNKPVLHAFKLFVLASLVRVGGRVFRFRAKPENETHLPFFAGETSKKRYFNYQIFYSRNVRSSILSMLLFSTLNINFAFSQTEGWTTTCAPNTPSVSEVMVDACGNEFQSEYVILRNGNQPFDITKLAINVVNPTNNAFVGQVTMSKGSFNNEALQVLTAAAGAVCPFGTVFRNIFESPYNGVVPENGVILFFVNKDSTDVAYIDPNTLTALCGSKVFVAFGDLRPQSRGVSLFRNYPQNGSCGAGGCLREIQFHFEGVNAPFCTQLTYDIKKLPHLNTTNPPAGFNEGSYIRPNTDGSISYGGGNLTGNGVCISTDSLKCVIPKQPNYGKGFWNISVFEGVNNITRFKGFYQAQGNHLPSETASTGSFEYNTARDGWQPNQAPSEAHPTYGALRAYDGCNVKADSFSILAKRQGFPCGNYDVKLVKYDDFVRIQIDADGNGVWDFDKTMLPPACASGCGIIVWSGALNADSKISIFSYDINKDFNTTFIFDKKYACNSCFKNDTTRLFSTSCNALDTGISQRILKNKSGCDSIVISRTTFTLLKTLNLDKTAHITLGDSILLNTGFNTFYKSIKWMPTEGLSCDVCLSPFAKPSISTIYKLQVKDSLGCMSTASISVYVAKKQGIFAPNIFSPNGDGGNEIFTIFTDASVSHIKTLKIFNRWGNLLFESFDFRSGDVSKGWNGRFNGVDLAPDVYIYFTEIEFKDGKKEVFMGDVTLVK
jgi:gliding motility-associated-like protein